LAPVSALFAEAADAAAVFVAVVGVWAAFAAANASSAFAGDCCIAMSWATLARFAVDRAWFSSPSARIATKAFIV
jgi:hypothetical protein